MWGGGGLWGCHHPLTAHGVSKGVLIPHWVGCFKASRWKEAEEDKSCLIRCNEAKRQKGKNDRRRTNVQQLTCNIELSCSFYYLFFSFVLIELNPLLWRGKSRGKNSEECETVWKFLKWFCPLVVALHFFSEMRKRKKTKKKKIKIKKKHWNLKTSLFRWGCLMAILFFCYYKIGFWDFWPKPAHPLRLQPKCEKALHKHAVTNSLYDTPPPHPFGASIGGAPGMFVSAICFEQSVVTERFT